MRGDRFLEETGGETCWCDEPVYFKEYNPAAEQVSWQLGFVKKKLARYCECEKCFVPLFKKEKGKNMECPDSFYRSILKNLPKE